MRRVTATAIGAGGLSLRRVFAEAQDLLLEHFA
jgi:hypothetical protein